MTDIGRDYIDDFLLAEPMLGVSTYVSQEFTAQVDSPPDDEDRLFIAQEKGECADGAILDKLHEAKGALELGEARAVCLGCTALWDCRELTVLTDRSKLKSRLSGVQGGLLPRERKLTLDAIQSREAKHGDGPENWRPVLKFWIKTHTDDSVVKSGLTIKLPANLRPKG